MNNGYEFYFKDGEDVLTFPITPSALSISIDSNNKVVTLMSEGEINILKSPSLVEVEFEARFPMRQYPYARAFSSFENYWNKFKELKEKKKSFRFIVARTTPNGSRTWDTNLLMALEDIKLKENASEGDDVLISFKLKQFKEYGVKIIKLPESASQTTSTSKTGRETDNKASEPTTYIVKSGDCLWSIAKKFYGDGTKWTAIYEANKTIIEETANKRRGGKGSSNGHWIYPGTELVIPDAPNATVTSSKVNDSKAEEVSEILTPPNNGKHAEYSKIIDMYAVGVQVGKQSPSSINGIGNNVRVAKTEADIIADFISTGGTCLPTKRINKSG